MFFWRLRFSRAQKQDIRTYKELLQVAISKLENPHNDCPLSRPLIHEQMWKNIDKMLEGQQCLAQAMEFREECLQGGIPESVLCLSERKLQTKYTRKLRIIEQVYMLDTASLNSSTIV
ncbi:MAG: hypothetical protein A2758_03100 [Candidatus Zambryskibacteria bacterium RIFCSPHIGHO2_01_FULL_49_18]|uniref:Uncharacterized protein n=2 Tax=Parcubacteria group TaxID=1794811 RepID=A0A1G2T392_9BACT|nr:MAG: hypothetical protein A2941_02300 [Candidatus Yanofskybacteria bacterium RIFCSPLOWO2_01_FULL_49_17]OHA91767.1 MAG: hypothetical protein A2758_03100 [Candidatus Zambryskibacteria bacterium RIFCSPHIGHO2_01_FULL_49_18]